MTLLLFVGIGTR